MQDSRQRFTRLRRWLCERRVYRLKMHTFRASDYSEPVGISACTTLVLNRQLLALAFSTNSPIVAQPICVGDVFGAIDRLNWGET